MMKKKQFIFLHTCKKRLSIIMFLLMSLLFQAKFCVYEKRINKDDSIQIQEIIYATENSLIYGLENVSVKKIQSPQVTIKVKKTRNTSKKKKSEEKKIVKKNYDKILNSQKSFSLFPSDIFLNFGNFGLRAQLIITSNNFCFKKNIVIGSYYIFLLKKYGECKIKIQYKYISQLIISIFLILFRLRPPPMNNNLIEV
ncbi:hypothetical protein [Chryseobacterium sp. M5A1_1a]